MERASTKISSDLLGRAREIAEARGRDERELLEELIEESLRMRNQADWTNRSEWLPRAS